jgi:TolB-like protein/Flp pilus assembly protein TadD
MTLRPPLSAASAVLALIAVLAFPAAARAQCADGSPAPCRQLSRAAATNTIAVLYFDNLSRDSTDLYLADGLTEELISRLTQIEQLQVKSRTAVARLRGRSDTDPTTIGRMLGVAQLLSGSVLRAGRRLRVNVELTRASTGNSVWGRSFDRSADDLLGVQAEIAESIAVHVAGQLAPAERRRFAAQPTRNARAYDHLLRARFHSSRRTTDAFRAAIPEFQAALKLDPGLLDADLGLAQVYANLASLWFTPDIGLSRDSLRALSTASLNRAISRDSLAPGVVGVRSASTDPVLSVGWLEAAIARDPRNAGLHHGLGLALRQLGRDSAAVVHFTKSMNLDPERTMTVFLLGQTHLVARRYRDAVVWLDSAVTSRPDAPFFYAEQGFAWLQLGDTARARSAAEQAGRHSGSESREEIIALIEARRGDTAAALARLAPVEATIERSDCELSHACLDLAFTLASVGARDRALRIVERMTPRSSWLHYWTSRPEFDAIRQDPRFVRVIQEARANMLSLQPSSRP